jgi:Tfp pilus assembly protein PilF
VQPDQSWIATNQIVAYLAVFGGSIALARLFPERWPAVLGGIAVAATVISGYALLVKVFPATFDANDTVGRLGAPFDYWNASGLIAALGLPACLWGGARRERARALRALAPPAIAILGTVIVLSYSRGALLAAVIGLACWFIAVPLRLRGALVLALGLAGAVALSVFALHTHGLTHNGQSLASRTSAGQAFGIVLVLVLAATTVAGFAGAFALDRVPLADAVRRRVAIALLVFVALIPVAGVGALAASSRGLTGQVSHVWSTLTNASASGGAANAPGRLVELGNTRGRYWSEGLKVGEHALLKGVGALGYATAVTRYTTDARVVPHAHSFVIQTFADFGLIGIAVMLALLIAWSVATARTLMPTEDRRHDAERAGLLTLLAIVVTFGVHSSVDWTWFVPGTALPALLCAGWLAGRGPLGDAPAGAPHARSSRSLATGAAALAVAAVAVILGWAMYQPLRSANANDAAIQTCAAGDTRAALVTARSAASIDPLSVDPLWEVATIEQASGQLGAARGELQRAVDRQPENPLTWLQLGQLDLAAHQPARAVAELHRAQQLDLGSEQIAQALGQAETALSRGG